MAKKKADPAKAEHLLENISQIIKILNKKGLKYNKRLEKILEILLNYLGVEQGSIMVHERNCLVVAAATRKELIGMKQSMKDDSIAVWVAKSREPIFIPDIAKDKRFGSKGRGSDAYKKNALLSAPILQDNKLLGVINVTDKEGEKDLLKGDITYLLDFSSIIISTIVHQKLQKELNKQKNTLRKRNKELKRQEKMRDELSRMLIHDLKAPLRAIGSLAILISKDLEGNFQFNTAISRIMELVNQTYKGINEGALGKEILKQAVDTVFLLLAPFTPHISEEVNQILGNKQSVFKRFWPKAEEGHLKEEEVEIAVLVNGKVRDKLKIDVNWPKQEVEAKALNLEKIKKTLQGSSPKKVVYIDKRIVNIVV